MCLVHEGSDTDASSSCNGCPSRDGVASSVRVDKDGAPENPATSTSNPTTRSRSCWYRGSGRRLCRFRRSSAKVQPETTEEADEMDSIEAGRQDDDSTGLEETAPNSPASGCKQDGQTDDQDNNAAKPGGVGSWLGRLLLLYSDSLDKWPVVTKAISSGLIGAMGDVAAQTIEWSFGDGPVPWSDRYVIWRSCAVMIDGFFVNGPLLHYAYDLLENYMPAGESVLGAMMQVGVDVFLIDPIFAFIFVWSTGLVEGLSVENDILHTIRYNFLSMVMWLVILGLCWAPLQIYLFNRYPVQFRVLVADFIDLVWTCVTSFFAHVRSS